MDISEFQKNPAIQYDGRHPWEVARAKIIGRLIKKYPHSNIVDIGAGDGFMAYYFSKNLNVSEIKLIDNAYNEAVLADIQQQLNDPRLQFYQSLEEIPDKQADIVLLLDVLEHNKKPAEVLNNLLTKKNGLKKATWIITVPAYQFLFSEHDKKLGHFKRYTRNSIMDLLKSQGFEIKKSGYLFLSLLLARLLNISSPVENWKGSQLTTSVLSFILYIDFLIGHCLLKTGIRLPGLSSYTICKPVNWQ